MIIVIYWEEKDLNKIQNRDQEVFEKIYNEYSNKIYNFLVIKTNGNKEIAEDLLSETFCSAIKFAGRLQSTDKLMSWLFQIARRRFYDHLRKKYRQNEEEFNETENPVNDNIVDNIEKKEKVLMLNIAIDNLKTKYRDLIKLKYFEHKSRKEIAEKLGKSISSIENLLYRARNSLKKELKKLSKDF